MKPVENGKRETFHNSDVVCPGCKKPMRGRTHVGTFEVTDGEGPKVGDVSICDACGQIGEYTMTLNIVPISDERLASPEFDDAREFLLKTRAKFRRLRGLPPHRG